MFLIFTGMVVLGLYLATKGAKLMPKQCEKTHKWVLRNNELDDKKCYLICKDCGKIPGEG